MSNQKNTRVVNDILQVTEGGDVPIVRALGEKNAPDKHVGGRWHQSFTESGYNVKNRRCRVAGNAEELGCQSMEHKHRTHGVFRKA